MSIEMKISPDSFKYLKPEVKNKAIGITNSLLKIGLDSTIAELIAISNAKLWACFKSNELASGSKNPHVHLIPHPNGWALISEDASFIYFTNSFKKDALTKARIIAKNEKLKLYIHSPVGNIHDSESFVVNKPLLCGPDVHSFPNEEVSSRAEKPMLNDHSRESRRDTKWVHRTIQPKSNASNPKGDAEKLFE